VPVATPATQPPAQTRAEAEGRAASVCVFARAQTLSYDGGAPDGSPSPSPPV